MNFINQAPQNIQQLVADANNKHCWKTRMAALEELRKYDCQQSRDVISRLALHDKVFKVKEEAVKAAQALGITKGGKPIQLGKKDIGFKPSDVTKVFQRIKHEQKMEELDLNKFKSAFQSINPEMLDVMSFEHKLNLDSWIEKIYKNLPKK
ncbi:HEAT repeat domain-containing protein [Aeromonas veronii]